MNVRLGCVSAAARLLCEEHFDSPSLPRARSVDIKNLIFLINSLALTPPHLIRTSLPVAQCMMVYTGRFTTFHDALWDTLTGV